MRIDAIPIGIDPPREVNVIIEVPVGQRRRQGGTSKVSGQLSATLKAAWRIAWTFLRLAISPAVSHAKR